jgi:hypothetical protein
MSGESKLDAPSRRRLMQLRDAGESAPPRVTLFLRAAAPFSPEQLDQLKQEGATIRTCAGAVSTIDVPPVALDGVLQLEFIVSAQISSPLYPERDDDRRR